MARKLWTPTSAHCARSPIQSALRYTQSSTRLREDRITTRKNNALRIGLTGGIASGKSTVADMFANHGVAIIDTDVIAREIVEPGQPALQAIVDKLGPTVLQADGSLDRAATRELVFADDAKRRILESILHPGIREAARLQAEAAEGPYHIVVVPLLTESPMRDDMDRILVVDCSPDVQLARLLRRDAGSEQQARRMIASQASREDRLAIADDVIRNDRGLEATRNEVDAMHVHYLSLTSDR